MPVLPDYLAPDLDIVFCGMAAGPRSAAIGHYYAGRGNRFWAILQETGLTPKRLAPEEDARVLEYGLGLTDLAKEASGVDGDLAPTAFDPDRLRCVLDLWQPYRLAFTGRTSARIALGLKRNPPPGVCYPTGLPPVWVLPSTSGAAIRYWDPAPWRELAEDVAAT
ncbi:mismatch-specific DNA-glycosylase [Tropicimonas sp. TH_r6]|uniref:mismatch-specific DNA-glycosylase n=1 Tax=Tropicimonas sp. TH_r6 TaxID=3082085 RepID=UPI00295301CC|nr:mismatch-specific DNA-glycosylase [Tropicimonas sp. TH_r6]MDV7145012.1 mismatch-specific DNA-glycosylase [Tropicimonas sp. TH_r6]